MALGVHNFLISRRDGCIDQIAIILNWLPPPFFSNSKSSCSPISFRHEHLNIQKNPKIQKFYYIRNQLKLLYYPNIGLLIHSMHGWVNDTEFFWYGCTGCEWSGEIKVYIWMTSYCRFNKMTGSSKNRRKWDGMRLCPSPKVLVAPVAQGSISIIKVTWSQKQIIWLSEQYDVTKGLVTVETPLVSQHVGSAGWFHQVNLEHCAAGKDNTAIQVSRSVKSLGIHVGMSKLVAVDMIQYRTIYGTGKKECKVKQCISQMLAYFTTCWGKRELNVEITKSVKGILKALDKQNFQNMPLLFRLGRMIKANIKEYG